MPLTIRVSSDTLGACRSCRLRQSDLIRDAGSHEKRLLLYPGSRHGWDVVEGAPSAGKARAAVISWIRR